MLKRPNFALNPSNTLVARAAGHLHVALWRLDHPGDSPTCELPVHGAGVGGVHFASDSELWVLSSDGWLTSWSVDALLAHAEAAATAAEASAVVGTGDGNADPEEIEAEGEEAAAADEEDEAASDGEEEAEAETAPPRVESATPSMPEPNWRLRIEADVTATAGQGRMLAVGDATGRVWLIEGRGDEAVVRLGTETHGDAVMALAFAPRAVALASSGRDRVIRTWRSMDAEGVSEASLVGATEVLEFFSVAHEDSQPEPPRALDEPAAQLAEEPADGQRPDQQDDEAADQVEEPPDDDRPDEPATPTGPRPAPLRRERRLTGLEGWQVALEFSPDAQRLATGGVDQGLYLFDLTTEDEQPCAIQFAHSGWVADVAWSDDSSVIATGSWDTTIGLFDGSTLEPIVCLQLHRDYVCDVEFRGPRLCAASHDREISVWAWKQRRLQTVLVGHTDWVEAITLLDRDRLLSVSSDRTARVFRLEDGEVEQVLGARDALEAFEIGSAVDMSEYVDLSGLASHQVGRERGTRRYRDYRATGFRTTTEKTALGLLEGAIDEDAPLPQAPPPAHETLGAQDSTEAIDFAATAGAVAERAIGDAGTELGIGVAEPAGDSDLPIDERVTVEHPREPAPTSAPEPEVEELPEPEADEEPVEPDAPEQPDDVAPEPQDEELADVAPDQSLRTEEQKQELERVWRREPSIGTTTIRRIPPAGDGDEPIEASITGSNEITAFDSPSESGETPITMGLGDEPSERLESGDDDDEFESFADPPSTEMGDLSMGGQMSEAAVDDEWEELAQTVDPSVFRTHSWPKPIVEDDDHLPSQTGEWDVSIGDSAASDAAVESQAEVEQSAAEEIVAAEESIPSEFAPSDDDITAELPADQVAQLRAQTDDSVSQTGSHQIWERLPSRATPRQQLLSERAKPGATRFALSHKIKTPHQFVYGVSISPDGGLIATCGADNSACVWSREGDLLHRVRAEGDGLNSVDFSFDGRAIVAGGDDRVVHMWLLPPVDDRAVAIEHAALRGHDGWISDVCFSPDGSFILTGSFDGTARVWKLSTGQCVRTLGGHDGAVSGVAIGTTRALSVGHDGTLRVWDQRWTQVDLLSGYERLLGLSTNGRSAAFCAASGEVFVLRDGRPRALMEHRGQARAVLVRGDGVIFSAGEDGAVRVYAPDATGPAQSMSVPSPIWCIDARRDIAVVGADDGFAYVFAEAT